MRIDSHHHLWNYSAEQYAWITPQMSRLQRSFAPVDLERELSANGIAGAVAVQARQSLEETRWLLETASENPVIQGVVGWLPLADRTISGVLEQWSQHELLKSIRHVVQDEVDDAFLLRADFNAGISLLKDFNLVYDILIYAKHLAHTITFVDQHPDQPFVLDHIAKPTIRQARFDQPWAEHIRELAKRPQVTCKFSALVTEVRDAEWTEELLRPYWDVVLEAFGPQRLMFGSDWPVCLLRSEYTRWVATVEAFSCTLSATEQAAVWGGTAIRTYQLVSKS